MIKRALQAQAEKYLKTFPAIVLLGPRQVGKTTLAKLLAKNTRKKTVYTDLEKNSDYRILENDAEEFLLSHLNETVLIDEVQRMPGLFPLLRAMIDEKRKPGRFILTGSASPELLKGASESLAGRVVYFFMHPIGLHELPTTISINRHWFRGGFPVPLTLRSTAMVQPWLDAFITSYIEKDLPQLFDIRFSSAVMRKLWTMLAHLQGGILNTEKIAGSLDVSAPTVKRYLDYLEAAFIITRLQPFFVNIGKRLVKAPKLYINDSGILHCLLRVHTEKEIAFHPGAGTSWEGYVISQVMYAKGSRSDLYYYRTQAGAECDLVLAHGHTVVACIEIKLSSAPVVSKGFYQSVQDLNCKNNFIICPGSLDYKTKEGVRVTGIKVFIEKYLKTIK